MAEQLYYDISQIETMLHGGSVGDPTKTWTQLQTMYPSVVGNVAEPKVSSVRGYTCSWEHTIANIASEEDLRIRGSSWNTVFKQGERGILRVHLSGLPSVPYSTALDKALFGILPDVKADARKSALKQCKAKLDAQGVAMWKEPEIDGNDLYFYIEAGILPLIAGICVVGVLIILGFKTCISTMTLSKIKTNYSSAAISAAEQIKDPTEKAKVLAAMASDVDASGGGLLGDLGLKSLFKDAGTAIKVVAIVGGIILAIYLIMTFAKR